MDTKFTKGPWNSISRPASHTFYGPNAIEYLIKAADGNAFAIISLGGPGAISSAPDDVEANARLIAASPALFEAGRKALIRIQREAHFRRVRDEGLEGDIAELESALRLATEGGQPK